MKTLIGSSVGNVIVCIITLFFLIGTIVVSYVPFLYNTVNSVLGGERLFRTGDPSQYMRYVSDYETKEDTLAAANDFNETVCEEGFTLLKNEKGALPLAKSGVKVTVFGRNSVDLVLGGSGSNAGNVDEDSSATIYSSLTDAGITFNPTMKSFYEKSSTKRPNAPGMGSILTGFPIAEAPISEYNDSVRASYKEYSDAAIVVISRIGGEGFDLPRTMFWNGSSYTDWSGTQTIPGARSKDDHYLQLDQNETDMLKEACENFDKVIVVINSSSTLELGFLDDPTHYAYHENILGAVWMGHPGSSGATALGKILTGEVVPSGRTVDTYARNFKNDPSWQNFGNNLTADGNRYSYNGETKKAWFVEYEEGIYVGYRYYETRGLTEGGDWYDKNVVYPFGYGLSYTDFDYTVAHSNAAELTPDGKLTFEVEVKNIGDKYAGKEVVQLYYSAPYHNGEIEKAHVVLGDFAKTKVIKKDNGTDKVTLEIDVRDMASYDYNDANGNGFIGYELDEGEYTIYITNNAHGWADADVDKFTFTVPAGGFKYETEENGTKINNLFDDVSGYINTYMSRSDFAATFPTMVTAEDRVLTDAVYSKLNYSLNDKASDPWYSDEAPTQSARPQNDQTTKVKLHELIGKDYNDPLWDTLLDQLTVDEMKKMIETGNYRTLQHEGIVKPQTIDADGPMGFSVFMGDPSIYQTCFYASECVMAATWNEELLYDYGVMIGNEGAIGNQKGGNIPYSGWYAPAMNIHRSQFGGRNFEYYSEDGLLSGKMAANVVQGAKTKGVYTYCKHFALNEQETNRDTTGLITWANEQAMRELYFVPFEIAVKEGETTAMMSAFNRIGTTWAGGNYNLLTALLRDEWGFEGMVITDYNLTSYMNLDQMIRAGGDLNLSAGKAIKDSTSDTAITAMRASVKNILYTVANSNAMNGLGDGVGIVYGMPYWQIALVAFDCILFVLIGAWLLLFKRG